MILRLEMILSVMSYGRKNIIFYEQNLKLTENNTFNNDNEKFYYKNFFKKYYFS